MSERLKPQVYERERLVFEASLVAVLELGRQRAGEPEPYALLASTTAGPSRLIVALQQEKDNVSRQHMRLEPLSADGVRVHNGSQIPLPYGPSPAGSIAPGGSAELTPPFQLSLPPRSIAVSRSDSVDEHGVQGLDEQTIGPGRLSELSQRLRPLPELSPPQLDALLGWLQTTMSVLQSTVAAADFLDKAVEALVQIIGLHSGRVLRLDGDAWNVAAIHEPSPMPGQDWRPSTHVLERVRREKRTFWQYPEAARSADTPSLALLQTVVAAPVLDGDGQVIGALYGERRREGAGSKTPIGKLEAMLVELLACGVATGLARQQQEEAALRAKVRFEQFFTPELAQQLAQDPDLLQGRQAEVTLLFCDVRGFSRFSEQLGPQQTLAWMNDVLGELSACVLREGGVLVDYVGDELFAMWGAPQEQPDQAERAVRAGLAMLQVLGSLNQRWQDVLGEAMGLGIGINTGPAQVGNTGSRYKFKYGPLGNTVNLASRVQGLTKYLKCRLLVTRSTQARLGQPFISRRVCQARVVNIVEPVALYEVEAAAAEDRRAFFATSEAALDALEAGAFAQAARQAGALLLEHAGDGPLLLILTRAAEMLMGGGVFDPVWQPPGK